MLIIPPQKQYFALSGFIYIEEYLFLQHKRMNMRENVLLCIGVVLMALVGMSSCSSDDENDNNISPVDVNDGPIAAFFKTELPERHSDSEYYLITRSFFFDPETLGGVQIEENIVCVINSRQELAEIYQGEKELPEIDFDKYTLIIGQQIMPYHGFYVAQKDLSAGDNGLVLTLYARNDDELLSCAHQNLYFWGLYPKLSQKMVSVNVVKRYTNRPDK